MKVPVSWLREYVPFDWPVEQLAAKLVFTSCEVDRIVHRGVADTDGNLGHFLVGQVVEAGKHPNADRLQLCRVDVGEGEPRQIVCGAWNFGAGATVAVALPGALLPGADEPLGEAKLRGETSRGMILSERELELGDDHSGIMVLENGLEPGTALADVLPLTETVLEIETGFNRPDLTSVYGIAREVSALTGAELAPPPGRDPERLERRAGRRARRRPRGVPALHRPSLPRREGRPVAGLAEGAAPRSGDASDLERRRRDELRDARTRLPAARLRPLAARGGADRRPPRPARGEDPHPGQPRARARAHGSRDRGREAAGRGRRDHGRRGQRSPARDDRHPARGGELRRADCVAHVPAATAPQRCLDPVGEGRGSLCRRAGGRLRERTARRSRGSTLHRPRRRARHAPAATGRAAAAGACRPADRHDLPGGRAARATRCGSASTSRATR